MRSINRAFSLSAALILSFFSLANNAAIADAFAGQTTRVSVSSAGVNADMNVSSGVISGNGRYVVFWTSATNMLTGLFTTGTHVYRHDQSSHVTVMVSNATTGNPGNGVSRDPSVSADGRYVVFSSFATDLVDGDTNGLGDVFMRDMDTGLTTLVSSAGVPANGTSLLSGLPGAREISDDGRYVVFISSATNLTDAATNRAVQVYVRDMTSRTVVRASVNNEVPAQAGNLTSQTPSISGDGHAVAFSSASTNISTLSTSGIRQQVFVRDLVAGATSLESPGTAAVLRNATVPVLSFDGQYLAFVADAPLDPRDLDNGVPDVYLRDRAAGTTVLASRSLNAVGGDSLRPSISSDGRWVGFDSRDETLAENDGNGTVNDVFLYDRDSQTVTLVSLNDAGDPANQASGGLLGGASVSSDGGLVLFGSSASNLVGSSVVPHQLYVRIVGAANQAPVVNAGPDETVSEGAWLKRFGTFSDNDASTTWSATADFGLGAFPIQVTPNTKHWSFQHEPLPVGTYVVTISVTDGEGATGSDTFSHTVRNVAPFLDLGPEAFLYFDATLRRTVGLSDPGLSWPVPQPAETYSATVNYGDGASATFEGPTFTLDHTYARPGDYVVTAVVSDSNGGVGRASLNVHVFNYSFQWVGPLGDRFVVGRNLPVMFTVRAPDGSFVIDRSVQVDVVDAEGNLMAGPYMFGDQPSRSVTVSGDAYHVNVDTKDLEAGMYTLRVRFSSPTLSGEFTLSTNGTASALRSRLRD
jgi:Tol biopolymer transport system component